MKLKIQIFNHDLLIPTVLLVDRSISPSRYLLRVSRSDARVSRGRFSLRVIDRALFTRHPATVNQQPSHVFGVFTFILSQEEMYWESLQLFKFSETTNIKASIIRQFLD